MANKSKPIVSPPMRVLATYIASAIKKPLPKPVLEKTKHHVLDTIAAMISGSRLLPGRKAIAYVRTLEGAKQACVLGSNVVTSAEFAALANGMLAHADETDDSHSPSLTHPGSSIVPAALAMGERERRNGTAFLRAVALGYDVGTRLMMALHCLEFRATGHATHAFGGLFGSTAAASALAGLNYDQARYALSYAAQQASGISCWMRDESHIEKAFDFAGMPARNAVTAAAMVAHGFTGVDDIFSGDRNFFAAYDESRRTQKEPDMERLTFELGTTFEIMNTNIKRWSVGSPIQAPLDALLDLIREHKIKATDVEKVIVRVAHHSANTTDNRAMPDISMQYMCSVMLIDGIATFESAHDIERMTQRRVRELSKRIDVVGDDAITAARPARQGIVEITLKDGRSFRKHVIAVRGTAQNPMSRAEVEEKAYDLMAPILRKDRARKLCQTIWDLDKVTDVRALRPLLKA